MKKYLLLFALSFLVFAGCAKYNLETLDLATITDLTSLQVVIDQVSEEINKWTLEMGKAEILVDQLQEKYVELTDVDDQGVEDKFIAIQNVFTTKSIVSYTLPLWAKKLGMTYPKGMQLEKSLCKKTSSSLTLVYTGNYTIALQQAEIIAKKANLYVSKNFQQAQALAKIGDIDYISGLDVGALAKWIVYVNHELLDTNMDNFLSVSVDQDWVLTIEATQYN